MIIHVLFKFEEIKSDSQEAQNKRDEMAASLETMAVAFDATECWIQNEIEAIE